MTYEEVKKQEEHDFQVFLAEVTTRHPEYTVTPTEYGAPYDAIVDQPDLSNQLIEIKQRWDKNSTDFGYYLIRKTKVDRLREICNEEKKDGYISYMFNNCWYVFSVNNTYEEDSRTVTNPIYGTRDEVSYRLYPEQGTRLSYRNNTATTMTDGRTKTERK